MEFTKKIGFIIGPYVKFALIDLYSEKMVLKLKYFDRSIELKKQMTYERGMKSKVLVVYVVEEEADIIDTEIIQQKFRNFKYLSYKRSTLAQRMAVMHSNKLLNINACYEILFNTNLDKLVLFKDKQMKLEEVIREQKDQE